MKIFEQVSIQLNKLFKDFGIDENVDIKILTNTNIYTYDHILQDQLYQTVLHHPLFLIQSY